MENLNRTINKHDPFLLQFQPSDLCIASEFLSKWFRFLSKDLCSSCTQILSDRIHSLDKGIDREEPSQSGNGTGFQNQRDGESHEDCCGDNHNKKSSESCVDGDDTRLLVSWKEGTNGLSEFVVEGSTSGCSDNHHKKSSGSCVDGYDTHSLESWKNGANGMSVEGSSGLIQDESIIETPSPWMSWADMAQEDDELGEGDEQHETNKAVASGNEAIGGLGISKADDKPKLPRDKREYLRFMNVTRKKDYICLERVNGKLVNILQGLELHRGVFSAVEQRRIVDCVYDLEEKGRKGELKERTYTAPQKWMRGKGRVTMQFGCCYDYAIDKDGNPPGILQNVTVDPIPHLFKVMIKRLVGWHVIPQDCVPDSCIVNIYNEGDCIPPHIDNHDFVRPFCTVSFLSQCDTLFGTNLEVSGPGDISGLYAIPLPVGSVLVLSGNGADVAKHCVPSVPAKRISITFRKMDESKRPIGFVPESDLQNIQPLPYEVEKKKDFRSPKSEPNAGRNSFRRTEKFQGRGHSEGGSQSQPYYLARSQRGPEYKWRRR